MRPSDASRQLPLAVSLNVEARFETYFAGENAAAIASLKAMPAPGIWLASEPSCGRTHLLQAVAAMHPRGSAMYLPLSRALPPQSIAGLAPDAVVCLDDVHCVAGNGDWEQALFALYETLLGGGGRLLVSAECRPAQSQFQLPDLVSRFASLAFYQLQPLSDEALVEALQLRAQFRGLELPDRSAAYLIKRLPREPAALFEWLQRLDVESLSAQRRLTLPFVRDTLAKLNQQ